MAVLTFDAEDETTWWWLLVLVGLDPMVAVVCTECGHVWPTGCHLTEGLAHLDVCPAITADVVQLDTERICSNCGDDLATEGYPWCTERLERDGDPPAGAW